MEASDGSVGLGEGEFDGFELRDDRSEFPFEQISDFLGEVFDLFPGLEEEIGGQDAEDLRAALEMFSEEKAVSLRNGNCVAPLEGPALADEGFEFLRNITTGSLALVAEPV